MDSSFAMDARRIKVDPKTHFLVDDTRRVRFFHGQNYVRKGLPWYPPELYDPVMSHKQLSDLQSWGINMIRLGTMWSGVQPTSHTQWNATYLSIMSKILSNLEDHGMHALLDMHQDGLSSRFGLYNGIPLWAADMCHAKHPYPWPFKKIIAWGENYMTDACAHCFQEIYNNEHHLKDYLASFWRHVATHFKDTKNVLGYEIMNEPFCGDFYEDPLRLLPAVAGKENLMPMYDHVSSSIREVDNTTLVFFEPVTWGMVFNGSVVGSGFDRVPLGSAYNDRSVFSWHYYCWFKTSKNGAPFPVFERDACNKLLGPEVFRTVSHDVPRLGGGGFLTEFGECAPTPLHNSTGTIECEYVLSQIEKYLVSYSFWDGGYWHKNGSVNHALVKYFARSYAPSVAGLPLKIKFNPENADFTFTYKIDTSITLPTEIFLPRTVHYTSGFHVKHCKEVTWKQSPTNSNLLEFTAVPQTPNDTVCTITITKG